MRISDWSSDVCSSDLVLARSRSNRQERIRRALPDTLDMLLVCVEAGVSLDAAILRVGREMREVHPVLANEFLTMSRKMNAGMRREDALHSLPVRTGVDELRGLASNRIRSEEGRVGQECGSAGESGWTQG